MDILFAAAVVFLGIHLLVSGTALRGVIAGTIGEGPYMGLFSLASLVSLVWLVGAYNAVVTAQENTIVYDLGVGVHDSGLIVIALAFVLGVQGLLVRNPTSVRQENAATKEETVKGVLRITRHPFLWGVILWSGFHIAVNGDIASIIFFGTFLAVALFGTYSIDAKRRRNLGPAWEGFAARTSNLPFAAIKAGRNHLVWREIFGWRFWAAAALFLAILFAHYHLFGVTPFPNGWLPF